MGLHQILAYLKKVNQFIVGMKLAICEVLLYLLVLKHQHLAPQYSWSLFKNLNRDILALEVQQAMNPDHNFYPLKYPLETVKRYLKNDPSQIQEISHVQFLHYATLLSILKQNLYYSHTIWTKAQISGVNFYKLSKVLNMYGHLSLRTNLTVLYPLMHWVHG